MKVIYAFLIVLATSHSAHAANANINQVNIGESKITLEYQGRFSLEQKQMLNQWVEEMASAVASIYGEYPLERSRIKLVRSYSWREPVPWGEVERWRGSRVVLHVNPNFSYQRIRADWTAAHELSHLLLPYVGKKNSWFSEGLASYYQNFSRGKVGLLSPKETFQKLYHGFRRGERNAQRRPVRLSEASSQGGNNMRVYWSGAAYFFIVDLKLRQASKSNQSLSSVLKKYKNCCLPNHRVTQLWRVIDRLDVLSGTKVFSEEYDKIIQSKQFPNYRESFAKLGITTGWGGVSFESNKVKEELRNQFFRL